MPGAAMRKITMQRIVQYIAILIIGLIIYSAYRKMSVVPAKSALANDIIDYGERTDNSNKDVDVQVRQEDHVKEHINKVFDDLKRDYDDNNRQRERAAQEKVKQEFLKDFKPRPIDAQRERDNEGKVRNEFLNDFKRINDVNKRVDNKDFMDEMFNVDGAVDGDKDEEGERRDVTGGGYNDKSDGADEINNEDDLDKEIEQRIAEVLKDAVNEVADGDADAQNAVDGGNAVKVADDTPLQEKYEFKEAINHLEQKLNPRHMAELRNIANRKAGKKDDDHEFPPFVTAARQTTFDQVLQFISSVQQNAPGQRVNVYDLDLTDSQKKTLMSICSVKVHMFMRNLFPHHISSLENYNWRPLVIQTALSEFGHITWVNPEFRLNTEELAHLVHDSHESGVIVIGQPAPFTTFAVTHPGMLKFLPTNREKLSSEPHYEIRAMMIHNTEAIHDKIMRALTACTLEETCISPQGAKWQCRFDFTGRKYAGCHRYDEAALNILLKNLFDYDSTKFIRSGRSYLQKSEYVQKPTLRYCRDVKDITL